MRSQAADAHRPSIDGEGDISSWIEPDSGIIRVVGTGHWSPADVEIHFAALHRLIAGRRAVAAPVLVLVDLTASPVQESAIAERIGRATTRVYKESDRVAVIVTSCLLKMQMKHVVDVANLEFFISHNAARMWLTAYH